MKNKYLVTVIVPEVEMEFDVYIPNNKKIGTVKKGILKSIGELTNGMYIRDLNSVRMFDRQSGKEYDNDAFVKDSEIFNGTRIIIM